MPNHRKTERKKQETTRGDYGTPKSPWDTETPTSGEDEVESTPREAQQMREEMRNKKVKTDKERKHQSTRQRTVGRRR